MEQEERWCTWTSSDWSRTEDRRWRYSGSSKVGSWFIEYTISRFWLDSNYVRSQPLTWPRMSTQLVVFLFGIPDINRVSSIESLGVTVSDSLTTSPHLAHKAFRLCEYFGHTAWQLAQFTWSSMRSLLRSSPTPRHHGGALRRLRIVNDWKRSFVAASVLKITLLSTCL